MSIQVVDLIRIHTRIAQSAEHELRKAGYSIILINSHGDLDAEKENFALFAAINILCRIGVATVFLRGSMILAKNIISAANLAEARMVGEKSELFTLSVVAYALLIATMSDQLKLSIEAGAVLAGIALMRSPMRSSSAKAT